MKSIHLKNFQCFKDSNEIPLHKITIFIGENDSGKTAIIKAMEIFFNNRPMTLDLFHKIGDDIQRECEIQIKFRSLHENDPTFPKQFIVNDEVCVKKVFSLDEHYQMKSEALIKSYFFSQTELNDISALKAAQLKEILPTFDLIYTTVDEARSFLREYIQTNFHTIPKAEDWVRLNWNDIQSYLPIFEYYNSSAIGNPVQLVASTLRSVYRSFFYDVNEQQQETLKPELVEKELTIKQELDEKIQTELKEKIREKNSKILNISGQFSIDFGSGFQLNSLQTDFGQGLRDINNIGEGSKKRMFLAITEWDKEVRSKKAYKKVIRGYDEPDTSLHYKAQKEMYYTLKKLSELDEVNVQPILCTHSLSMIDRAPPRIINQVVNKNGISYVNYLKGDEDHEIKEFLDNVSSISGISNSSLFFERCFLIVEGETEFNAIPEFYRKITQKSIHEDGVVLVNIEGNGSWRSFLKLLNKNKQKSTLLFLDADIQHDGRRSLTSQGIREVGFDDGFIGTNVIFVGTKEFEDIFSNQFLSKYLNKFHPKLEGALWIESDIQNLRNEGKFSENIQNIVGKYQYEKGIRNRDFKKSEFGTRVAGLITRDELMGFEAFRTLVEKISNIVE
ncbi:ATP-dependent nuclease [Methanoregula sp.]|uniref:ATP-dependent nuclease n=1 Tax=Methanoregula sp. TaxID=2052170 RepID=UPI002B7327AD|nr:AAA family ATPase [Methanoregula sp.]HVP97628.1 AAA family ATPase [Methanoregula sp.]